MHICQDEIAAAVAAVTAVPFVRVAWFRLRARLSRGRQCAGRPACGGHGDAGRSAPPAQDGAPAER